jgi:polar amino acid transport system substrate-binding protein
MTVEDVTREEQEKQRLFEEDKNKTLNSLIAGIAHEIKNPLMTIQTATSLIIEQGYNLEVRDAFTMFVPHEIDRINQLIEGFINYARPLRGGVVELFCISTLIKECIYLVKIMSKKDKFIIITDIEEELYIYANKDKIKQSIINLIINGIESMKLKLVNMPEAILKMSIKTYSLENDVFVKIRDQGVGMSLADIKKCTQPFFTTKTAGTGLGLAIVKQFIQENDGTLAIDSEKGKYAEFSIIFRRYYHDKE